MKIGILGCKGTTLDLLHGLNFAGIDIHQVVTLPEPVAQKNRVAFFRGGDIEELCNTQGIPCHTVISYNLKRDEDLAFFQETKLDLLLVIGWERLVPNQALKSLGRFACGMHGSPFGLPKGRGRSPMNWSLITGHKRFVTYLFRYTPGTDDGDVIGFKVFDINEHDTIASLHHKNRVAMGLLVRTYLPQIADDTVRFIPQPAEEPSFYPKRTPEDGIVDFYRATNDIHRFVRALAPPYPGAFCKSGTRELRILAAQPFDSALFPSDVEPGTILDVSIAEETFVVKTLDGSLLVSQFTGLDAADLKPGTVLAGGDHMASLADFTTRYDDNVAESQMEIRPFRRSSTP